MFSLILNMVFSLNLLFAQAVEEKSKTEDDTKAEAVQVINEAPDTKMLKFNDIIITSSYGAFAGSVIGLATLAFASKPGSKLKNIAIGASIGLYAGTLLGLYLSFAVGLPKPVDQDLEEYENDFGLNYERGKSFAKNSKDLEFVMPVFVYNF